MTSFRWPRACRHMNAPIQSGLDDIQTGLDDLIQSGLDDIQSGLDDIQTGLDDLIQSGLDDLSDWAG